MRLVKTGIANIDTKVKAFNSNADKVIDIIHEAAEEDYTVVAFPEQTLFGYSPEDLVEWTHLVQAQLRSLRTIVKATEDTSTVFVVGATVPFKSNLYNCAVVIQNGTVLGIVPKQELPNYNVFYEQRNFTSGKPEMSEKFTSVALFGGSVEGYSYVIPFGDVIFDFDFGKMGVEVCEDIWSPTGPMGRRTKAGAELIVNISASPYRIGVLNTRREMVSTRSGDNLAAVVYANLVGANDGLVFDGGGFIANCGRLVYEAPRFKEQLSGFVVDLDTPRRKRVENTTWRTDAENNKANVEVLKRSSTATLRSLLRYPVPAGQSFFLPTEKMPEVSFVDEVLDAIAWGIGGYFEKVGSFKHIGIALSGGRDSLLALICARRWIDLKYANLSFDKRHEISKKLIHTFYMPTKFSSNDTDLAARIAAHDYRSTHTVTSIQEEFELQLKKHVEMIPGGGELDKATRQNIQARIRAGRMWSWANTCHGMYIQTGNMTEKVMGYFTMGGDSEGALAIISNLPKTVINYILARLEEKEDPTAMGAIRLTTSKPASAELDDDQEDEKDMIPYPDYRKKRDTFKILDACMHLVIGEKMSLAEATEVLVQIFPDHEKDYLSFAVKHFAKMFGRNIFKWKQSPTSLHLGNLDLDHSRALQVPVIQEAWTE